MQLDRVQIVISFYFKKEKFEIIVKDPTETEGKETIKQNEIPFDTMDKGILLFL